MSNYLKFGILFVICSVLLTLLSPFVSSIFEMFGVSLNYVTSGSVGSVLSAIVGFVGWFLDILFINQSINYVTHFGGIVVGSISWTLTVFRVLFGLSVLVLILQLIIER